MNEGAGDSGSLGFAAGKFAGEVVAAFFEADDFEGVDGALCDEFAVVASDFEGEGDVFENGFLREEFEVLEDDANAAAVVLDFVAVHLSDVFAEDGNAAVVWFERADHGLEKGCFARA